MVQCRLKLFRQFQNDGAGIFLFGSLSVVSADATLAACPTLLDACARERWNRTTLRARVRSSLECER